MKTQRTKQAYYFYSAISLGLQLILTKYFYIKIQWNELLHAAKIFLPLVTAVTSAILLLILSIYLFKKAFNHDKAKKHVRFL